MPLLTRKYWRLLSNVLLTSLVVLLFFSAIMYSGTPHQKVFDRVSIADDELFKHHPASHGQLRDQGKTTIEMQPKSVAVHSTESKPRKLQRVLISTIGRSGSSFLGNLFAQHKDVVYFFEPLIYTGKEEHKLLERSTTLRRSLYDELYNCDLRESNSLLKNKICALIRKLPNCPKHRHKSQRSSSPPSVNAQDLYAICENKSHVVIKEFAYRLPMKELREQWKQGIPKVIMLVRDPRAIFRSWAKVNSGYRNKGGGELKYCKSLYENIQYGLKFLKPLGFFDIYRYEDICSNFTYEMKRMMTFLQLPSYSEFSWTLKMFPTYSHFNHTLPIIQERINKWREEIETDFVTEIEENCKPLMDMFGYTSVSDNESILRNLSISLFSTNINIP